MQGSEFTQRIAIYVKVRNVLKISVFMQKCRIYVKVQILRRGSEVKSRLEFMYKFAIYVKFQYSC